MKRQVKYPDITVNLSDCDGNVFALIGAVRKAMRRANIPVRDIEVFTAEAKAGDYDHALQTIMQYVETT